MSEFIKKFIRIVILFTILLWIIGYYLDYSFSKDLSNKFTWVNSKKNGVYDYAFLGSSRVLNGIDICLFDSISAQKGINLGIGGASFRTLYMQFYVFTSYNDNHVKDLYLQMDPFMLYKDSVYNNPIYDYYFIDVTDDSTMANLISSKKYLIVYKYFPVVKYIELNEIYNLVHFIKSFKPSEEWEKTMGSKVLYGTMVDDIRDKEISKNSNADLNKADLIYLSKILDLCNEKNIRVHFYTAPIYTYRERYAKQYPYFFMHLDSLCIEYGLSNSNKIDLLNESEFFNDKIHLNQKGTRFLTKELALISHSESN